MIGLHSPQVDQLAAAAHELSQFGAFRRVFFEDAGLNALPETGQDERVETIGLGQDAERFGEVADLPRVDHGDLVTGFPERGDELAFVTAGCFNDNACLRGRRQLRQQFGQALASVGGREALGLVDLFPRDIERILGDVDSDPDERAIHNGTIPSLRMRARGDVAPRSALAAVRANDSRPAAITLGYGVVGADGCSIYGRPLVTIFFAGPRGPAKSFHTSMVQDN